MSKADSICATEVRERPILFSGEMVRAILSGRKTQTRRVIKPQPDWAGKINCDWYEPIVVRKGQQEPGSPVYGFANEDEGWRCPYGAPGDRLWVRETFCEYGKGNIIYRANYKGGMGPIADGIGGPWKPSIFMPRKYSRITLEVTEVRVQRVQEISHRDALAEGVEYNVSEPDGAPLPRFQKLWDRINGKKHPWESNPWVWCVSFSQLKAKLRGKR